MTMKWKRLEPGKYQCGDWVIVGKKSHWELYNDAKLVKTGTSKGQLQKYVESPPPAPEIDPDDVPVKHRASKDSLESVLASLRLEIDSLKWSNNALAAAINDLTAELKRRLK